MTKEERKVYNRNWRESHKGYYNQYMKENGRRVRGSKRFYIHWTDELKEEFVRMYQDKEHYHISEIAIHFGVSKIALQSMAKRLKIRRS